jgi:glycosyltransferase involved in cell wall biosynthesis
MKIAIDISPLNSGHYLQHRVRGTGFYLKNLKASLEKYYPENKYIYFNRGDKLDPDVDVVHYPYFEPFFLTLPLFSKNKTVVTVHDLTPLVYPDHFESGLKGNIKWQIQKLALSGVSGIITDSQSSKKDIIKYAGIPENKIKVVYLAAGSEFRILKDKEKEKENIIKKYHLPQEFILYVGDATWNKNLPRLIEAVSKINVTLVMTGQALTQDRVDATNPWNKDLILVQELAKKNKNILLPGFVSQEDLVALYNSAGVFVMPSIYEGFGLPVLEAMSCGCPVIASRAGSLAEVAGEAIKHIDPFAVDSIAEGIKEVLGSSKFRQELSEKGLKHSKKFTWEKTAGETVEFYKSIKD